MAITVKIPAMLRPHTNGQSTAQVEGNTVREVIEQLGEMFPALHEKLCDEEGALRKFVVLYLDKEDVRALDGLDTEVDESKELTIVVAIAGG